MNEVLFLLWVAGFSRASGLLPHLICHVSIVGSTDSAVRLSQQCCLSIEASMLFFGSWPSKGKTAAYDRLRVSHTLAKSGFMTAK